MPRNLAPVGPNEAAAPVDPKTGRWTQAGLESHRQTWRQVVSGFVIVPCVASGTNVITLKPRLHKEGAADLGDGMTFVFAGAVTSTGLVSIILGTFTARNAYKNNGAAQATTGDVVAGSVYLATYWSALNGGAGGFVLK